MLLVLLLACRREPYIPKDTPDTQAPVPDTVVDTDEDDPGDTSTPGNVWDDPAWWVEPGPFAPLVDFDNAPTGPHWEAWFATSPDLKTWSAGQRFAFGFSSLDLLVLDEGLIVGGSLTPDDDLELFAPFEHFFAIHTPDLKTWGSHQLFIENAAEPMIIDPSMHKTPDGGLRLVYYGSSLDVDPLKLPDDYPNPHAIYTAMWDGEQFVQEDHVPLLEADYVVDPSGCYHDGVHYMMGTRRYGELYFVSRPAEGGEYKPVVAGNGWGGVQVPYCYSQEERPVFIAQYGGGYGDPQLRRLDEEGYLTEPESLLDIKTTGYDSCTSPLLGYFQDTYVLFCSTWIQ